MSTVTFDPVPAPKVSFFLLGQFRMLLWHSKIFLQSFDRIGTSHFVLIIKIHVKYFRKQPLKVAVKD